jgi:haloalkane dehalogenase
MTALSPEHVLERIPVLDSEMTYRESGATNGPTVLFLHGNPTSSFIWRNIIPRVAPIGRCIAPDLIGFGQSGKPAIDYRFVDHVRYLDAFIEALGLGKIVLVAQDWGTALAFHFARRQPERVLGMVFMEFIRPMASWDDFHQIPQARATFQKFRTPGEGEAMILEGNVFIERLLPGSVVRRLSDDEMDAYRQPFPTPESRKPIWRLPNELPIAGEPADVFALLTKDHEALAASRYPKLLICGNPGAVTSVPFAETFAARLHDCALLVLPSGRHYLQEDHPTEIGNATADFLRRIGP